MIPEIIDHDAVARHEERRELFRIAAQNLIDAHNAGRKCDPEALQWARGIVSRFQPLGRPLSDGAPKDNV